MVSGNQNAIDANERHPLFAHDETTSPSCGDRTKPVIDWADVEQATHLVTDGQTQSSVWRASSPVASAVDSMTSKLRNLFSGKSGKKSREAIVKVVKNVGSLCLLSFLLLIKSVQFLLSLCGDKLISS